MSEDPPCTYCYQAGIYCWANDAYMLDVQQVEQRIKSDIATRLEAFASELRGEKKDHSISLGAPF